MQFTEGKIRPERKNLDLEDNGPTVEDPSQTLNNVIF